MSLTLEAHWRVPGRLASWSLRRVPVCGTFKLYDVKSEEMFFLCMSTTVPVRSTRTKHTTSTQRDLSMEDISHTRD